MKFVLTPDFISSRIRFALGRGQGSPRICRTGKGEKRVTEHPSERPSSEQLVLRAQAGDASATEHAI